MEVEKVIKRVEDLFFFSLLKMTKICFGSTKMGFFFFTGKSISRREKNQEK